MPIESFDPSHRCADNETSPMTNHITCKSCEGTGRWHPPGQDLKCLGCDGAGHIDLNAEYLRVDHRPSQQIKRDD